MVLFIKKIQGEFLTSYPNLSKEEKEIANQVINRYILEFKENEKNEIHKRKEDLENIIFKIEEENFILLDSDQKQRIKDCVFSFVHGLGPFDDLLKNDDIEEIAVIGPNKPIFVYLKNKGWLSCDFLIENEEEIIDMANKMAKKTNVRLTIKTPRINSILEDNSRLHASCSPISEGEITIRRFLKNRIGPSKICKTNTMDFDMMAFLSLAVNSDISMIIAGNTASGKTTTLNSILSFIHPKERIISTEETPEIFLLNPHFSRLISSNEMDISLEDIIYDTLRMRPDKIIVGEVRTPKEIFAFTQTIIAGQGKGSFATMHAQSASECISRFKTSNVMIQDLKSLDLILIQKRTSIFDFDKKIFLEQRKITQAMIPIINNKENIEFIDLKKSLEEEKKEIPLFEKIKKTYNADEKQLKTMIKKRSRFLKELSKKNMNFQEEIKTIWRDFFAL